MIVFEARTGRHLHGSARIAVLDDDQVVGLEERAPTGAFGGGSGWLLCFFLCSASSLHPQLHVPHLQEPQIPDRRNHNVQVLAQLGGCHDGPSVRGLWGQGLREEGAHKPGVMRTAVARGWAASKIVRCRGTAAGTLCPVL